MPWSLKSVKTQKVTPLIARKFVEMHPSPSDRPLSLRRLAVYRKLFEAGQFRPVTWAEAFCLETSQWYRVNGKHTSLLLTQTDPFPGDFYVTIESYECDGLEDVARLYGSFDSKMQSRTAADIYRSFASTITELRDIGSRNISTLVAGIGFHYVLEKYFTEQPADRAERLLDQIEFASWVNSLLWKDFEDRQDESGSAAHRKAMSRQPIIAAMLGSWNKNRDKATEFWTAVRDMTDPNPKSPSRKLAMLLTTSGLRGGGQSGRNHNTLTIREMYVKCIAAWNAWRRNENTDMRYYKDKPVPTFA